MRKNRTMVIVIFILSLALSSFSSRAENDDGNIIVKWSASDEPGISICNDKGIQRYPKVTYYNDDWNVIVWEDERQNQFLEDNEEIFNNNIIILFFTCFCSGLFCSSEKFTK